MYKQVEKPKENTSKAVANSVVQKRSNMKQGFVFLDNRPEMITQRKIQVMADEYSEQLGKQNETIQRRVKNFKSTIKTVDSPIDQIRVKINYADFTGGKAVVDPKLEKLDRAKHTDIDLPTRVRADVNNGDGTIPRIGGPATEAGRMGREEMMLKRGQELVAEGGHLIPHHALDSSTAGTVINSIDSHRNIVPMSRTMNVINWSEIEKGMTQAPFVTVDIRPNYNQYDVTNRMLNYLTGIPIAIGTEDNKYTLDAVISTDIQAQLNLAGNTVSEPEIYEGRRLIQNKKDLITALKSSGIWNQLDNSMINDINTKL